MGQLPDEYEQEFVSAVFNIGLKTSSPKVAADQPGTILRTCPYRDPPLRVMISQCLHDSPTISRHSSRPGVHQSVIIRASFCPCALAS